MTVTLRINSRFPDSPYQLFRRGLLDTWLGLPLTSQVEVVAGDAYVAHATGMSDEETVSRALAALVNAERADPAAKNWDVDVAAPSLTSCFVVDVERLGETDRDGVRILRPGDLVLVVGVGRVGEGADARAVREVREVPEVPDVPFYLEIDRGAVRPGVRLHVRGMGVVGSWKFGEVVRLPEPFGFGIGTGDWVGAVEA